MPIGYDGFYKIRIVDTPQGTREVVEATNSVSILFYFPIGDKVLLIKEPRASMISDDNPEGITTQSVSGRFDVDLSPKALMIKEADEEAGVLIEEEDIVMLNGGQPMAVSAGMTNEMCYLAFAEIYPEMIFDHGKIFGCPTEGEKIERVWINRKDFISQPTTCVRVFAFQQWLINNVKR